MNGLALRRASSWMVAGLVVCLVLALRDLASVGVRLGVDQRLSPGSLGQQIGWEFLYYLMWAALAPFIFALARRVPIHRRRWLRPLAFHLGASVAISASAPLALSYLFGALVRGYPWSDLPGLIAAFWTRLAAYRALADASLYWIVLAAGFAFRAYDEDLASRRQAAELARSLVAAQVESLKMKLQPHFFFNTLNSISFLAVERDTDAVVTMVERLAHLLRSSMHREGSHLVTVKEELALLDQYLAIEEVRFSERLRVVRAVPPAVLDALVPSLILQPIVENSIKHGFSQRLDASRLDMAIRREGDRLVVTVQDDGPGLPAGWDLATRCGRGLKNVIERLEKLYPGEWSFGMSNRSGGGAVARLKIPWQEQPLAAEPRAPHMDLPVVGGVDVRHAT